MPSLGMTIFHNRRNFWIEVEFLLQGGHERHYVTVFTFCSLVKDHVITVLNILHNLVEIAVGSGNERLKEMIACRRRFTNLIEWLNEPRETLLEATVRILRKTVRK